MRENWGLKSAKALILHRVKLIFETATIYFTSVTWNGRIHAMKGMNAWQILRLEKLTSFIISMGFWH